MRGLHRKLPMLAGQRVAEAARRSATLLRGLPPRAAAAAAPFRKLVPPLRRPITAVAGLGRKLPAPLRQRTARAAGLLKGLPLRAWQRAVVAAVLAAVLLLGGALVAGASASGPSDRILAGVKVAGLDVGRMTRGEAIQAVQAHLRPSLQRPIMIRVGSKSFRMTPAGVGRGRAVDQAVDEALAGPRLSVLGRFWHKVVKRPVTMNVDVAGTRQDKRVAAFVSRVAAKVAVAPVDAAFELRDGEVVKQHARTGRTLDQAAATKALVKVLGQPNRNEVKLRLQPVAPKMTDAGLGKSIEIGRASCRERV